MGPAGNRELLPQRDAIIAWVNSAAPQLPRVDAKSPAPKSAGRASVNFDEGYVLLVPQDKGLDAGLRLVWSRDDKEKTRAIPPGTYALRRYAVSKGDWQIWATGKGRAVEVREGEETKIELDLAVTLKTSVSSRGNRANVGGNFVGDSGMGLSLLKGEDRITVGWKALRSGKILGSGDCTYG